MRYLIRKLKLRQIQANAARFTARCLQKYWPSFNGKRVLFIDDLVPHASLGAGFPRSNRILSEMVQMGLAVTLYPASPFFESWKNLYKDISLKVEIVLGYGLPKLEQFLKTRRGYDLLFVSRPHNMKLIRSLLNNTPDCLKGTKIIYDAEAIYCLRQIERLDQVGETLSPDQVRRLIRDEVQLGEGTQSIVSVSDRESQIFSAHGFEQVFTLGHLVDATPTPSPFDARADLLFVGAILGDDSPNLDSLMWFGQEILPIITATLGRPVNLIIAGAGTADLTHCLAGEAVKILGTVDDLTPLYDQARLFVAPTRFAAGIPLKVYEAAAHGLPVVTTSLLAAQLGWTDGIDLLVANDARSFASACIRLYLEPELWNQIRANALERVRNDCSPGKFSAKLKHIVEQTIRNETCNKIKSAAIVN